MYSLVNFHEVNMLVKPSSLQPGLPMGLQPTKSQRTRSFDLVYTDNPPRAESVMEKDRVRIQRDKQKKYDKEAIGFGTEKFRGRLACPEG